ncbi:hypothetical protein J2W27_000331 [Variovorax boronicumulans]|uniref:hypothetical protein n=1 Tax=Variovorax boronicumulans TaxID=436515 RepID=UPI00277D7A10|nr:hypothetical protein [Variovorax boronicumulans]MDP9908238.1 hypothetical protein [Variovorax boronicumulans]
MACDYSPLKNGDIPADVKQAQANVWYACKYIEAVEKQTLMQNIVAGIQSAAQLYFADKQHEIAKQAQDRLDLIADEQMRNSANLRGQFEYVMACERAMADDACDQVAAGPDYYAIKARVIAPIRAQFSRVLQKLARCYPTNCVAMALGEERRIRIEEAKAITRAVEMAYRREEQLFDTRKAQKRAERLQALQAMRGHAQASSAALQGAAATVQAAAGLNPYLGWTQAINGISDRVRGALGVESASWAAAAGMMRTGHQAPTVGSNSTYDFQAMDTLAMRLTGPDASNAPGDGAGQNWNQPQLITGTTSLENAGQGMGPDASNPFNTFGW